MNELAAIVTRLMQKPEEMHALATLVSVEGSSYRRTGARLLIDAAGSQLGSISGGCLESDVVEHARIVLSTGTPKVIVYDTTSENDLVWGVGTGCHGVVRIFIERIEGVPMWAKVLQDNFTARRETELSVVWESSTSSPSGTCLGAITSPESGILHQTVTPPVRLLIFGAGDDAQPLARLAKDLGWEVQVHDPRAALATRERFPTADRIASTRPDAAALLPLDTQTLAVIMTHHYVHDVPLLRALLPREPVYLGLLGPKKRADKILDELARSGFAVTEAMRARLHAPVGLDLGGDEPQAVALAILAEMQSVLAQRDARPLRERARPIHS